MILRVLLTVPSLDTRFGGSLEKVRGLTLALQRCGVDAIALGCGSAPWAVGITVAARFHATPVPAQPYLVRRLVRGADIVHVVGYRDPVGALAAGLSRRAGVPFVIEPAGMYERRGRSMALKRVFDRSVGRLYGHAAMWIATSELEARELSALSVQPEHIRLRPNGVDQAHLLPLPSRGRFREATGIPSDVPLVIAVGRVARVKNLTSLVRAIAPMDAWLAIIGPDSRDGALEEIGRAIDEAGIGERVQFVLSGLWGTEKAAALADADCLCLPSWSENFGNAAAEAAAVGLPVVVSNAAGVAEWLPAHAHYEVDPSDIERIRSALKEAITPHARHVALSSCPSVRSTLDWTTLAERQREWYSSVIR